MGFVFRVTKTLLLLIVAVPDCTSPCVLAEAPEVALDEEDDDDPEDEGVEGVEGTDVGVGVGVGALQTEGCPVQVYPFCIWQLMHPEEYAFPVSQV